MRTAGTPRGSAAVRILKDVAHIDMRSTSHARHRTIALALFITSLMLASSLPMMVPTGTEAQPAGDPNGRVVVYHPYRDPAPTINAYYNSDAASQVSVTYYGDVVSSEYNPQFWSGASSTLPDDIQKWYEILRYGTGRTLVFTGWSYGDSGETHYPGDIIPLDEFSVESGQPTAHLYATWAVLEHYYVNTVAGADLMYLVGEGSTIIYSRNTYYFASFSGTEATFKRTSTSTNTLKINNEGKVFYDRWGSQDVTENVTVRVDGANYTYKDGQWKLDTSSTPSWTGGTVYTNVIQTAALSNAPLYPATVHGLNGTGVELRSGSMGLSYDLILDNMAITGKASNHGNSSQGIFANGKTLVLGTGITNGSGSGPSNYPQVFGGSSSGTVESTQVIIHSGTYGNIIGGSYNGTVSKTAKLVLRDVTVLDTLIGAGALGTVGSGNEGDGVYVYATALNMPGDTYEENRLGSSSIPSGVTVLESTILTGGSNDGRVNGDTHVLISGTTSLWDVQGAGRRGASTVTGTAEVVISGKALVKHIACGSITDGIGSNPVTQCVMHTDITVKDAAMVASVFGAGYDTYYSAGWASMWGNDSTIKVSIEGGTVGHVYGGGYRGSVGCTDNTSSTGNPETNWIGSVDITVSGGTVLGSIYGGGRGGLDKILHNTGGSYNDGSSHEDSTGYSRMFAKSITVKVTGGTVNGSVYGGGQGVPAVTGYSSSMRGTMTYNTGVAETRALSIDVEVSGGSVAGDVYGGGRGIRYAADGSVESGPEYTSIIAMGSDGLLNDIPWIKDWQPPGYATSSDPASNPQFAYAMVRANNVRVAVNSEVGGSVFGGGALSVMSAAGPLSVVVNGNAKIGESVFGAGRGYESNAVLGSVVLDNSTLTVSISNYSDTASLSVFGGGRYGQTSDGSAGTIGNVNVLIEDSTVNGTVYGGGQGKQGSEDLGYVRIEGGLAVTVRGDSAIGSASAEYALFGGGAYSHTSAGQVRIALEETGAKAPRILSDVHGGGLGYTSGTIANNSMSADRHIIIRGAVVDGSVYGGSRVGNDGAATDALFSCKIDIPYGTVNGSVFGGGLQGRSWMSSEIRIGVPAFAGSGTVPAPVGGIFDKRLRLNNIYGGSNITLSENPFTEALLMGSSLIEIGGTFDDGSKFVTGYEDRGMCIHGTVFGDGNYTKVAGTRTITIDGYEQHGETTIWSIQRADVLEISRSYLGIRGASDGGQIGVSQFYSVMRIGSLTVKDRTTLELLVESADIGSFSSYTEGRLASRTDFYYNTDDPEESDWANRLILHSGNVFTVLKEGDYGFTSGVVQGFTLLEKGEESGYYGAYVVGSLDSDDSTAGFMVLSNKSYVESMHIDTDTEVHHARTWYIAGHSEIKKTWTFSEGSNWAVDDSIALRKTGGATSVFAYNAMYNGPLALDTLYMTDRTDFGSYIASLGEHPELLGDRMFYSLSIGASGTAGTFDIPVRSHKFDGTEWVRYYEPGYSDKFTGTTPELRAEFLSKDYFCGEHSLGLTGNVGKVTLSIAELIQSETGTWLPVNLTDVEITFFMEPKSEPGADLVNISTVVNTSSGYGEGYVVMPDSGTNTVRSYYVWYNEEDNTGEDGRGYVWMVTDQEILGTGGWLRSPYLSAELHATDIPTAEAGKAFFGEAGLKSAAIKVIYRNGPEAAHESSIYFRVVATEKQADGTERAVVEYKVKVTFQPATVIYLQLYYTTVYGGVTYAGHLSGSGTAADPYIAGWPENPDGNTTRGVPLPYGSTTSEVRYWFQFPGGTAEEMSVAEAIGRMKDTMGVFERADASTAGQDVLKLNAEGGILTGVSIVDGGGENPVDDWAKVVLSDGTEIARGSEYSGSADVTGIVYGSDGKQVRHYDYPYYFTGWFKDPNFTKEYDPYAEVRESLNLYAGFGLTVVFHGEGVNVSPQSVLIRPGTSLNDNGIYNIDQAPPGGSGVKPYDGTSGGRPGYALKQYGSIRSWAPTEGGKVSDDPMDFTVPLYTSMDNTRILDLYLVWVPQSYRMLIQDRSGAAVEATDVTESFGGESEPAVRDAGAWIVHYDRKVQATFSGKVESAEGTYTRGGSTMQMTGFTGLYTATLSFIVPLMDEGGTFTIKVVLSDGTVLTLQYVTDGWSDSLRSGESVTVKVKVGDDETDYLLTSLAQRKSIIIEAVGGALPDVSITAVSSTGYRWALWAVDGDTRESLTGTERLSALSGPVSLDGRITLDKDAVVAVTVYRETAFDGGNTYTGIENVAVTSYNIFGDVVSTTEYAPAELSGLTVFKGYGLAVTPEEDYRVSKHDGLTRSETANRFTVIGSQAIVLEYILDGTFTIKVIFVDWNGDGIGLEGLMRSKEGPLRYAAYGVTGEVRFTATTTGFSGNVLTIPSISKKDPEPNPSCTMTGFDPVRVASSDPRVVEYRLTLIRNTISFCDPDGTVRGTDDWSVLTGGSIPRSPVETVEEGGAQAWVLKGASGQAEIVKSLTSDRFTDRELSLYRIPVYKDVPIGYVPVTVVVKSTELHAGCTVQIDLGTEAMSTVAAIADGKVEAGYSNGTLTLESDMEGTGSFLFTMGEYAITVVAFPDFSPREVLPG